jgi:hypothetical protein
MQILAATSTTAAGRKPNHCINKSTIISKYPFGTLEVKKANYNIHIFGVGRTTRELR